MKPRPVTLEIEVFTDVPVPVLKRIVGFDWKLSGLKLGDYTFDQRQVSANVIRPARKNAKKGKAKK